MANPGHDLHNIHVDDVLVAGRQKELADTVGALSSFHPTKVAVEWPEELVAERYPKYLAGTLPPSRNEVVQLGFRLTKMAGSAGVYGIDADGDFPFGPVMEYARSHGQMALMDEEEGKVIVSVAQVQKTPDVKGIAPTLRLMNQPERIRADQGFYRDMLKVGGGTDQPGLALVSAWYKRNLLICANLLQLSRPGDRIVVFYGAGHAFLLRQCVTETPGYVLVEPNMYLPQ